MPGGASAYLIFANANRSAVRDELLEAQGADGNGKIGIAQVSGQTKGGRPFSSAGLAARETVP